MLAAWAVLVEVAKGLVEVAAQVKVVAEALLVGVAWKADRVVEVMVAKVVAGKAAVGRAVEVQAREMVAAVTAVEVEGAVAAMVEADSARVVAETALAAEVAVAAMAVADSEKVAVVARAMALAGTAVEVAPGTAIAATAVEVVAEAVDEAAMEARVARTGAHDGRAWFLSERARAGPADASGLGSTPRIARTR